MTTKARHLKTEERWRSTSGVKLWVDIPPSERLTLEEYKRGRFVRDTRRLRSLTRRWRGCEAAMKVAEMWAWDDLPHLWVQCKFKAVDGEHFCKTHNGLRTIEFREPPAGVSH